MTLFRIYNVDESCWWRNNAAGYTNEISEAGLYTLKDACEHVGTGTNRRCGRKHDMNRPADAIVPAGPLLEKEATKQ